MRTTPDIASHNTDESGFTLTDLLAVIMIVGILGVLLLPALASTKPNSQGSQCLENQRQLVRAWQMYADDNSGGLVASLGSAGAATYNGRPVWMTGSLSYLTFGTATSSNWDTNQDIVKSPLWTYVNKNAAIFKCPADTSTVKVGTEIRPRVRSVSMSQVFDFGQWLPAANWRLYAKTTDIVKPAHTFVFIDENPIYLNDGGFATQCAGSLSMAGTPQIIDVPGSSHSNGGSLSFSDGHVDMHRWYGPTILNPSSSMNGTGANLRDFTYLAENSTVLK